ncbi:MAG: DUF5362 family protein [Chitinophagaceae bacterium]
MEQNQDTSLFGINVDQAGRAHLADAAKWAKFLAIMGFIGCALVVLIGIFFGSFFSMFSSQLGADNPYNQLPVSSTGFGGAMAVMYVLIALVYFFPCLYLFRFATRMKNALASNDQAMLNTSFQNLKAAFRFVGILMIIGLCFWVLAMIVSLLVIAMGSNL